MTQEYGRRLALSPARRLIADLTTFAMRTPLCTVERTIRLSALAEARQEAQGHPEQLTPGWCSLFTKAYAGVAARRPELRRAYIPWPWPHLYEHPINVASVAIERRIGTENGVLFAHLRARKTSLCWPSRLTCAAARPLRSRALPCSAAPSRWAAGPGRPAGCCGGTP